MIRLLLLALLFAPLAAAPAPPEKERESEEFRIGVMVKAIAAALKAPEKPESLETIAHHGTDSRYYTMIRGWLVQELKGVESQLEAARDETLRKRHRQKVDFLRKAIRRIDLE